jgi:hypothetical protein
MAPEPDPLTTALADAKVAIERGNYARAVALLEPLCERHSPLEPQGDLLRLLLATALMGQGQGERAAACCRSLQTCADPQRRAQARDLLQVLEAPALKRPRDWSLTLPRLDQAPPLEGVGAGRRSAPRPKADAPPPPPVGPTRSPRGFAVVVVMVLVALLLSSFLAGCMRVETQLDFSGPGRVHLRHRLQPIAGTPFPFQRRLAEALAAAAPPYQVDQQGASTVLFSPLLTPAQALDSLRQTVEAAAALGGLSLPAPALKWQETNWLLGVQQHIQITLDLQTLSPGSGLDLRLRLSPLARGAVRRAFPQSVRSVGGPQALIWPLQLGEINTLEIRCWRWSPLGLGALLIAVGLLLVVQLQRMRVRLGMGLPELPA